MVVTRVHRQLAEAGSLPTDGCGELRMAFLACCCSACYVCAGASVDRNGLWCAQEGVSAARWVRRRAWVHPRGGRMKLLGAEKVSSAHRRRFLQ